MKIPEMNFQRRIAYLPARAMLHGDATHAKSENEKFQGNYTERF